MKNRVLLGTFALLTMLSMSGCGGGNDDVNNEANNSGSSVSTGTAFYIDSAVGGVNYKCGSQEGITGTDGAFTFEVGGSCTFYLGNVKLRDVDAELLIDGKNVYERDVKIGRILQSLDSDGNLDNGITIAANTVQALADAGITSLPTSEVEMDEILAVIVANGGTEESEEDVAKHMLISLLGGKTFYSTVKTESCSAPVNNGSVPVCEVENSLEQITFNADLTNAVFVKIDEGSTKEDTEPTRVVGNRIYFGDDDNLDYITVAEVTADYVLLNIHENGKHVETVRLYFERTKAEAYLAESSVPPVSKIDITAAMLSTKTFYDTCDNNEGCYAKMTFDGAGTGTRNEIYMKNGERIEAGGTFSYSLLDGKMEVSGSDGDGIGFYMLFTLTNIIDNTWVLNRQDGEMNPTFTTDIWFMTKPSGFPAEL